MVTIRVPEDGETANLLRDTPTSGEPLRIAVGNLTYLVRRANDEPWVVDSMNEVRANYSPARVREALRRSAGALSDINREVLLADLRKQREQGSTGRPG